VARLSYDVTEKKLRREFEEYGAIKRIQLVENKKNGKWSESLLPPTCGPC
jgi:U1 small nuclear ribonucleoprotein 70kDa